MDVYLLRTSVLETVSPPVPEGHAYLSLAGRQLVRAVGNRVRLDVEPSFDRFVISPATAAAQTAELFADRVDYVGLVEVLPSLSGGVPPQIAAASILGGGKTVAVVADEPALSALGAFLIGRPTFPLLQRAQVSLIRERQPAWYVRADVLVRAPLLVA